MARPLRLEFPGALYHVTARGDRREAIVEDDVDRERFVELLGRVVTTFNWRCHAWCLMTNHYHLLIETPEANLSKGMRQLNGVFTQFSNRRHKRSGHVFQGRYKAILVDEDAYLLELARYVVLNPVRARMVRRAEEWRWSSHAAMMATSPVPAWLTTDRLLATFGSKRHTAIARYARFVADGAGRESVWKNLNAQVFLGDEAFVRRSQQQGGIADDDVNIPMTQRRPPPRSLADIEGASGNRDEAIVHAYQTGGYSYAQIGKHFGLHFTHVGRIVRRHRDMHDKRRQCLNDRPDPK